MHGLLAFHFKFCTGPCKQEEFKLIENSIFEFKKYSHGLERLCGTVGEFTTCRGCGVTFVASHNCAVAQLILVNAKIDAAAGRERAWSLQ